MKNAPPLRDRRLPALPDVARLSLARALLAVWVLSMPATALAQAQAAPIYASAWLPGPGASGTPSYSGTMDAQTAASSPLLTGWVVDTTAQGWSGIDDVQIWTGQMDAGGQLLAHPIIQLSRPDVAAALNNPYWAASGYAVTVASGALQSAGSLYVYAHTPAKGWWYQDVLLSIPAATFASPPKLDIEMPTPLATLHNTSAYTMRGSAYDPAAPPNAGTGVDRVQVYLNGDRQTGIYVGDATLGQFDRFSASAGTQFARAGWELTFQPSSWLNTLTDDSLTPLVVYAHSSVTGQETKTQTTIVITLP